MPYSTEFSKGLMLVLFVADKVHQGVFDYVPTRRIAETMGLAQPTTAKILRSLRAAGIIEAKEGLGGGVRLGKAPDLITVLDVLEATEGGKILFRTDFQLQAKGNRPVRAQELAAELFIDAENSMRSVMQRRTIASLLLEMGE